MNKPTEFPLLPRDNKAIVLTTQLIELGKYMKKGTERNTIVDKAAGILVSCGYLPFVDDRAYFLLYEECLLDYPGLADFYNPIIKKGMDYALKIINDEIGDMGDYFNSFQSIFYIIAEESKVNESYNPLALILWTFYMSLYSRKRFEKFVNRSYSLIENSIKEKTNAVMN
jgi:hypothetical protein